jgi:hypothetical protein
LSWQYFLKRSLASLPPPPESSLPPLLPEGAEVPPESSPGSVVVVVSVAVEVVGGGAVVWVGVVTVGVVCVVAVGAAVGTETLESSLPHADRPRAAQSDTAAIRSLLRSMRAPR